jgi:hypothetical protein
MNNDTMPVIDFGLPLIYAKLVKRHECTTGGKIVGIMLDSALAESLDNRASECAANGNMRAFNALYNAARIAEEVSDYTASILPELN